MAAARLMGADLAYIGTRFVATQESMAPAEYRRMILEARAKDILYTAAISGVKANFLRASIAAAGLDPDALDEATPLNVSDHESRPWKNIWSAGHGVGGIEDVPGVAALCQRRPPSTAPWPRPGSPWPPSKSPVPGRTGPRKSPAAPPPFQGGTSMPIAPPTLPRRALPGRRRGSPCRAWPAPRPASRAALSASWCPSPPAAPPISRCAPWPRAPRAGWGSR
ncbi:NAD(P)H-dependent flavin oxidoreductase [Teichococcus aestuarii]|uniref:NAD(P)H-dependent flavin oxidoreductase n=1 Tax=Teichococcus aestuarii TaxID=568898 RepID=UPI003614F4BB